MCGNGSVVSTTFRSHKSFRFFRKRKGVGPVFLSDLTREGALPLSLRFLDRQGRDFSSPTTEMPQPSQRTRKAGHPSGSEYRLSLLAE
jgi:hypothetical protein